MQDVLQAANAQRLRLVQTLLAHGADVKAAAFIPENDGQDTTMQSWNAQELVQTGLDRFLVKMVLNRYQLSKPVVVV